LLTILILLLPPAGVAAEASADSPYPSSAAAAGQTLIAADKAELRSLRPPLLHARITSPFGERLNPIMRRMVFHRGIDYGAASGTPIYAAQLGTVVAIGLQDHAGIYVRLRHSGRIETLYAHLARLMPGLRRNAVLRAGDILGFVGASGFATGPHLHYEVLVNGQPIDPATCQRP
jgi:murein DD-endopeptidase MepM/ murein hydrolase activator NlpD